MLATNVKLHGTRAVASQNDLALVCSQKRESPRRKAVASQNDPTSVCLVRNVKLHGARPWPLELGDTIQAPLCRA